MTAPRVADAIARALASIDPALGLRDETDADFTFVRELYAEIRHDELAAVPWPDAAKRDFLDSQCRLQWDHYAQHYVGAERLLILEEGAPFGRIYVHAKPTEFRLMDIAVASAQRNRGIGTLIVRTLQDEARRINADLTLHVEPTNPAQRMYQRLGFRLIENRGVYDFLGWTPPSPATADNG